MSTQPKEWVPLEEFRLANLISPLQIELAVTTGTLATLTHEGRRCVDFQVANTWLAAEPASPLDFAMLGARLGGKHLIPRAAIADDGAGQ